MSKQVRDAITYAKGSIANATAALESGAIAKARIEIENGTTVLRAAYLMNDIKGQLAHDYDNAKRQLKALTETVGKFKPAF